MQWRNTSPVSDAWHSDLHRGLPAALCALALFFYSRVDAQNTSYCDPTCERQRAQEGAAARQKQQAESAKKFADQFKDPDQEQPTGSARTAEDIRREVEAQLATKNAEIAAVARAAAIERETARIGLRRAVVSNDPNSGIPYLEKGGEGQQHFDRSVTLLMVAAWRGHAQLVGGLARADKRQLSKDADGNTAITYAAASGRRDVILRFDDFKGIVYDSPCNAAGWSALALAASQGHDQVVQAMLKQGANPNACADQGVPALVAATAAGNALSVRALLDAGAEPLKTGRFGVTAEQVLAQRPAQVQVVQAAAAEVDRLRANVDFAVWNKTSSPQPIAARPPASFTVPVLAAATRELTLASFAQGRSSKDLIEAVQAGRIDAVRTALSGAGPEPVSQQKRETALVLAAGRGLTGIVQLLVEPSTTGLASVDSSSTRFFDAIDAATNTGKPDVLRVLLGVRGIEDRQGRLTATLGKIASYDGYEESVRLLIAAGAQPGPWFAKVLQDGGPGMLKVFMAAGADIKAPVRNELGDGRGAEQGFTSLMKVTENGRNGAAMARALIDAGVDVNARTNLGRSALWYTLSRQGTSSKFEIAKALIQAGADVNVRDKDGYNPLMLVGTHGGGNNIGILRLLLEAGADVNARSGQSGDTPLMSAVLSLNLGGEKIQFIGLLIDAGADVLAKKPDGTPIRTNDAQVMALLRGARESRLRGERPGEHPVQPLTPALPATFVPASQPPATVRWENVSYSSNNWDDLVYFDQSSIVRDRQLMLVWVLNDNKQARKLGSELGRKSSQSSLTQYELNCEDHRVRSLQTFYYSQHMGKGKPVASYLKPELYPTDPGSHLKGVLRRACP